MIGTEPALRGGIVAQTERCARHAEVLSIGDHNHDTTITVVAMAMLEGGASTVAAERERCAAIVRDVMLGGEPEVSPLRGLLDAILDGDPAEQPAAMCNLYRITSNVEAMRRLFKVADPLPNLPLFEDIYPNREAPIIRADADGARRVSVALWGVPPPGGVNRPVTNVRNLASPFWRSALSTPARRCLVPVTSFSEWTAAADPVTGRKRKVWFGLPAAPMFAFAGIARASGDDSPDRFAFLTCAPNAIVGAVHPKAMPVILTDAGCDAWLDGMPAEALAVPFSDADMAIVGKCPA